VREGRKNKQRNFCYVMLSAAKNLDEERFLALLRTTKLQFRVLDSYFSFPSRAASCTVVNRK